jgi:hypothetical protein
MLTEASRITMVNPWTWFCKRFGPSNCSLTVKCSWTFLIVSLNYERMNVV